MSTELAPSFAAETTPSSTAGYGWLAQLGFPELADQRGHFSLELVGLRFDGARFCFEDGATPTRPDDLSAHLYSTDGKHAGWVRLSFDRERGVSWEHTKIVSEVPDSTSVTERKIFTVRADGLAGSLEGAANAAIQWGFAEREIAGMLFYQVGMQRWQHCSTQCAAEVCPNHENNGFVWNSKPASLDVFFEIAGGSMCFFPFHAKTEDEALMLAATYETRVISAMASLTKNVDAFELGRKAGTAELLTKINALHI